MFSEIEIKGARHNNLKNVSLKIPKHHITAFVGLSGSGKSSLAYTLTAAAQHELNETYPPYVQHHMPRYPQPSMDSISYLPVTIAVNQQPLGRNERSTVGTYTGLYSSLRLLYSRSGLPFVGYSDVFSFNQPEGMCPTCQGLGYIEEIQEDQLIDPSKSLEEGGITLFGFKPHTWRWERYAFSGLFDINKPLSQYTPEEYDMLMHAPQQKLKDSPPEWAKTALYEGVVPRIKRSIIGHNIGKRNEEALKKVVDTSTCPTCQGTRLKPEVLESKIDSFNIAQLAHMDLIELKDFFNTHEFGDAKEIATSMLEQLDSLINIGLGYLSLDQSTVDLSGGEAQRIKIARHLTSALCDVVYLLDEPSTGLHPYDLDAVGKMITSLRDHGNTVIIVEHNPALIKKADHIVELGPGAGAKGGNIIFNGSAQEFAEADTSTAHAVRTPLTFKPVQHSKETPQLNFTDLNRNNIKNVDISIPTEKMTVLTGVAGSGKSSIMKEIKSHLKSEYVDLSQKQISANVRSTTLTYLGIFDTIRTIFAKHNNVSSSWFSYNSKGACYKCKGKGEITLNMAFMDPVIKDCEICHTKRYNDKALSYTYKGKNIADILSMSVSETQDFFSEQKDITQALNNLKRVGLSYISLNRSLSSMSGGELQRLKLSSQLTQKGTIFLLDEPAAGLHPENLQMLLPLFDELVDQGNTLIVIDHNLELIAHADHLIEVGPLAGKHGGNIVFTGSPKDTIKDPQSKTGQAF